jgi:capsular polysaccharide biosynthesis protein
MEEISIFEILYIIKKRRMFILVSLLVGLIAGFMYYYFENASVYEYAANIYTKGDLKKDTKTNVKNDEENIDITNDDEDTLQELEIGEQLTKDYMSFLSSSYVLENIQVSLKEKYSEFDDTDYNKMNSYIKSKINIKSKGDDSRFLEVSASDENPDLAKDIVKFAAEELEKSAVEVLGAGNVKIVDVSMIGESESGKNVAGIICLVIFILGIVCLFSFEISNGSIIIDEFIESKFNINLIGDLPEY